MSEGVRVLGGKGHVALSEDAGFWRPHVRKVERLGSASLGVCVVERSLQFPTID